MLQLSLSLQVPSSYSLPKMEHRGRTSMRTASRQRRGRPVEGRDPLGWIAAAKAAEGSHLKEVNRMVEDFRCPMVRLEGAELKISRQRSGLWCCLMRRARRSVAISVKGWTEACLAFEMRLLSCLAFRLLAKTELTDRRKWLKRSLHLTVTAMKGGQTKSAEAAKTDGRLAAKKGSEKRKPKSRGAKDPSKPKRPPSAFFVFMEQFRKEFKEKNPNNKLVSVVGKAGGAKWKSMSETEKSLYVAKASKLKEEYQKKLLSPNAPVADDDLSDKAKSEISEGAGSNEEEDAAKV